MFNIFKKKPKAVKKLKQAKIKENQSLIFKDLLNQEVSITREIDGHNILLGLNIKDEKVILDQELSVLLLSVLKEYCMTKDIEQSLSILNDKGE